MPVLTPLSEASKTVAALAEASKALAVLVELANIIGGTFPCANAGTYIYPNTTTYPDTTLFPLDGGAGGTYPSAAGTYPTAVNTGLVLTPLTES